MKLKKIAMSAMFVFSTVFVSAENKQQIRVMNNYGQKITVDFIWKNKSFPYNLKIEQLKTEGFLYPCFESAEELSLKKKSLLSAGKPPIYDRSALFLSQNEINEKINSGLKPHWRFKLEDRFIKWNDLIKGEVKFESKNLSDPILIREDGSLLYHLPSVIDDIEENISHIVRGEDHISNTAFHIQIFKALNAKTPQFAHHPFLTDQNGNGFGKRIGSLSIENLKSEGYENISIINYLINIGSSENIRPERILENIIETFDIKNISNSSAQFSPEVLKSLNSDVLKNYTFEQVNKKIDFAKSQVDLEKLWLYSKNNIVFLKDMETWLKTIDNVIQFENYDIPEILIQAAIENIPEEPFTYDTWDNWTKLISNKTGLKGRKLFMPLRIILTGKERGPELKNFLPLLDKQSILRKFRKI